MSEDRPQYQLDTVPTNAEIAERLRAVAHEMRSLGGMMDYVGGMGDLAVRGRLLFYMTLPLMDWAHEIEGEAK